jgi:hypothetical protein
MVDVHMSEFRQIRTRWDDATGRLRVVGGTPFWDAVRHLAGVEGSAILWTNLIRSAAVERGTLTRGNLDEILGFQPGLLAREIKVLGPTSVVRGFAKRPSSWWIAVPPRCGTGSFGPTSASRRTPGRS